MLSRLCPFRGLQPLMRPTDSNKEN
uniref:Uncharacterized protein n=1 Tax=Anguilla anguilla TaxID=7936 RepID=A0A0E9SFW4_ANGAN